MAMSEKNNSVLRGVAAGAVGLASTIASKARAQGSGKADTRGHGHGPQTGRRSSATA